MKSTNYRSQFKIIGYLCLILTMSLLFLRCSKDQNPAPEEQIPGFTGVNTQAADRTTRFIYIVPSDSKLHQDYTQAVENCATSLSQWYKDQLNNGKTFHLNEQIVETIQSEHPATWFSADNGDVSGSDPNFYFFNNAKSDIMTLLGDSYNEDKYTYVVYIDAQGSTGAGYLRLCIMPQNDLLGLTGQMEEDIPRWIGGTGHELGHGFGLDHLDNQDPKALMWTGYTLYPDCYFSQEDLDILNSNSFIY